MAQNGGDTRTSTGYHIDVSSPAKVPILKAALEEKEGSDEAAVGGPIDSLIICTKAQATSNAIQGLQTRLSPSSVITLLQNGMGVYDELCAKFWPDPRSRPNFILGTTTHGVTPTGTPGSVQHMSRPGQGAIKWGIVPDPRGNVDYEHWLWGRRVSDLPALTPPDSPRMPLPVAPEGVGIPNLNGTISALLSMTQLSPVLLPMPHLYHELLLKLAVNAAINPLTAVLGGGYLYNGSLHRSGPGHRLVQQTCKETSAVLCAYLHNMSGTHPAPPDTVRMFSPPSLVARVHQVIAATRENVSSMAGDVKNGRETEIAYINGYLVSLGNRLGVPTPTHRMLSEMVKFKAEVGGLNQKLYPSISGVVRRGEQSALEARRMSLEDRKISLEERKLALKEEKQREIILAKRQIKRRMRRDQALRDARERDARGETSPSWEEKRQPKISSDSKAAETGGAAFGEVVSRALPSSDSEWSTTDSEAQK